MKIEDPTGWTVENNPHPCKYHDNPNPKVTKRKGYDWKDYYEFDEDGMTPVKCHMCLKRAEDNNGNCMDGGEYFICLPEKVRRGKVKLVKTRQVTF